MERDRTLPRPDWYDKDPAEWPDSARRFWSIIAVGAQRRMAAERDKHNDKP